MPQASAPSSPSLGIRLEGNRFEYVPGDTIIGYVYRKAHTVSPRATIEISLHGKAHAKLRETHGDSSYRYNQCFPLIAGKTDKIFVGPLHIPEGREGESWPFSITLPTHVQPKNVPRGILQMHSYLPTDPVKVAAQTLPSTFTERCGFGSRIEGFIEYYLQARLQFDSYGSNKDPEAILQLKVNSPNFAPPIADFKLRMSRLRRSITAHRLAPGMKHAELSFSQKAKQAFRSRKVPTFTFVVEVSAPKVLQIDNQNQVPILVRVVPIQDKCSEVVRDNPPKIKLTKFTMKIISTTEVRCGWGSGTPDHGDNTVKMDLGLQTPIDALEESIQIPCTEEWPAIDIGEKINLRIGRNGRMGQPLKQGPLFATFTSYNVRLHHRLSWKMEIEIAGERVEAEDDHSLTVLAPSRDKTDAPMANIGEPSGSATAGTAWIRPPEGEEVPPTFGDAQNDVVLQQSEPKVDV